MVLTKEPTTTGNHLHFNGIHHATVYDDQGDLFMAYQAFACHHSINDADMYENAASIAPLNEQKELFLGLAGRKRTVVHQLKMNGADNSVSSLFTRNQKGGSLTRYIMDLETTPLITMEDAFNLAYRRENKTLLLYEKLLKTISLSPIKILFDYLIESQREHIGYITRRLAAFSGRLEHSGPASGDRESGLW